MTLEELAKLGPTIKAHVVAGIWGISEWSLYEARKRGQLPVMPLEIGRSLVWPTIPVLESVGIDTSVLYGAFGKDDSVQEPEAR